MHIAYLRSALLWTTGDDHLMKKMNWFLWKLISSQIPKQSCKKKHSTYNINSGSAVGEAASGTSGEVNTIKGVVGFGERVDVVVVARVC